MDSLSSLDPLAWEPEYLREHPAYAAGNALGWLYQSGNKQAATSYPLAGRLYLAKSGWLLLSVPNALVRGVFDAMVEPGVELPTAGVFNVPNVDSQLVNAHISVMTADEVQQVGADKINERGHMFGYTLGSLKEISVKNVDGVSKVWVIQVSAPGLSALRKSYGLSALPNEDQPFHITVAARRKGVLLDNGVAKGYETPAEEMEEHRFSNPISRGELKAAAVYNFEGDVQGVSLRKTLHKVLEEMQQPGLMYNNAHTGEARAVLPGNKNQQKEVLDRLRQRLADRAAENAKLTGRPGEAKVKKPLQEGVDYKITPLPGVRERMRGVTMTPADIQHFIRSQGFNRLAAEPENYQKQWLGERYRLQADPAGNLVGAVPALAKKQLLGGEPIYAYQTVPGWNDEKAAELSRSGQNDLLQGGKADNVPDREISAPALAEGAKHEHEHTNNDQVAKEIAKDHLSEDPAYYEKVKVIEKDATAAVMQQLRLAKEHSDNKRYDRKHEILRRIIAKAPKDWEVDDDKPKYKGITHTPTKFKFHAPADVIGLHVKAAQPSVYGQQFQNLLSFREPFVYDHNQPVYANVLDHLYKAKRRGDFILQSREKSHLYKSMLDPHYRYQMAQAAATGTLPQMNSFDKATKLYGNDVFDTIKNWGK